MKAKPAAGLPADAAQYAFEFKWDGMRALAVIRDGRLELWSRNHLEQAFRYPELHGLAKQVRNAVLDGEVVVFEDGKPSFARLQQRFALLDPKDIAARARAHPVHFVVFDVLELDGRDLRAMPIP